MTMDENCLVYHKEGLKRAKADPEHRLGSELKIILKWWVKGFGGEIFKLPCTDTARNCLTHCKGEYCKNIYGIQAVLQDCGTLLQWIYFE